MVLLQGQIAGGRRVRAFQFLRELSTIFARFWDWIHPEALQAHRRLLPESMIDDVLLAFCLVSDLRAKVSPLVVATDAPEWGLGRRRGGRGGSRTSSLTAQRRVALQEFQQATPS